MNILSLLQALRGQQDQNPDPVYGRDPNAIDDSGWGGRSTGDMLGVSSMRQQSPIYDQQPDQTQMPDFMNDPQQNPASVYGDLEQRAKYRGR